MATIPKNETKNAIMDTAELLMAEHGINGVSLRAILSEAGANSAALHYHFGSRDGLIEAILTRTGRETSLRRREMLRELDAKDAAPVIQDVVDAMVDPMLEMLEREGEAGRRFLRFLARLQSDRTDIHRDFGQLHFPEITEIMQRAIGVVCPDLSGAERERRFTMALDVMLQTLASAEVMTQEWKDEHPEDALAELTGSVKSFLAGGLSAPMLKTH